jgi:SAM-dependent methyltransferase
MTFASEDVARYYDENTKRFLVTGQGGDEGAIHRAVWGEGVTNRAEAFHFVHEKLVREVEPLAVETPRILDLGCGVGASLAYILKRAGGTGIGVTNSEVQASLARSSGVDVEVVDFCSDPLPRAIDLAFGIESFVQAANASSLLANVARSVRPGGKLVLCDDFLGRAPLESEKRWLDEFREGWHASSLVRPDALDELAVSAGFEPVHDEDLTPFLELDRPRDVLLHLYMALRRPFGGKGKRFLSLSGGSALRQCLKRGLVTYRYRVWRASADSL